MVERAKAGDKCVFTGTFIVVPDVAQLGLPGVNAEMLRQANGGRTSGPGGFGGASMGVSGLKALGVKDLTYKTAFLACMVQSADSRVSGLHASLSVPDHRNRPAHHLSACSLLPRTSGETRGNRVPRATEKSSCRRSHPMRSMSSKIWFTRIISTQGWSTVSPRRCTVSVLRCAGSFQSCNHS